jgi:hypothetical protein
MLVYALMTRKEAAVSPSSLKQEAMEERYKETEKRKEETNERHIKEQSQ